MNTSILKKCLDELSAETPRIDYVKGMLETLIEMSEPLLQVGREGKITEVPNLGTKTLDRDTKAIFDAGFTTGLPPLPDISKIAGIVQQSQ